MRSSALLIGKKKKIPSDLTINIMAEAEGDRSITLFFLKIQGGGCHFTAFRGIISQDTAPNVGHLPLDICRIFPYNLIKQRYTKVVQVVV